MEYCRLHSAPSPRGELATGPLGFPSPYKHSSTSQPELLSFCSDLAFHAVILFLVSRISLLNFQYFGNSELSYLPPQDGQTYDRVIVTEHLRPGRGFPIFTLPMPLSPNPALFWTLSGSGLLNQAQ